jgi:hypothetical protein
MTVEIPSKIRKIIKPEAKPVTPIKKDALLKLPPKGNLNSSDFSKHFPSDTEKSWGPSFARW